MSIIAQSFFSFFACLFFAIIYKTPKSELLACGITGAFGYGIYYAYYINTNDPMTATFLGAATIAFIAKLYSSSRKLPVMLYVLPPIFPLVPGANMYYAAYGVIMENIPYAVTNGVRAFKLSGLCVIALLVVFSIPNYIFDIITGTSRFTILDKDEDIKP